jgi:hypothetical protein
MAGNWQRIDGGWLLCHSWQYHHWRMITAMTTLLFALVLLAGLAALVSYARHDHFAGPTNTAEKHDELGSLALRGRVA